ncbi:zinc-dependent metalloprotease [Thalassotalea euphylliae]|uniref:zinc-dependent metalloprotease n=1 Tax=Thalassotalea euphylliae TaxID=1655234 RepID=UPI00362EA6C5
MKNFRLLSALLLVIIVSPISWADIASFAKGKDLHQGFFSYYIDDQTGKVYLEIDAFDQPFLFQSSMPHGIGSNDIGLDRGQLGDTRIVQFERVGDKVFLRQLNTYYRANSDNTLERQAIDEAFASSIIWGFKVAESDKDKVVVDYTPFLLSDIHGVGERLKNTKQGNFKVDATRSGLYKKRTKTFPKNTEFEATITFKGSGAGDYLKSVTPDNSAVTVNFHHSLIELPDDNYQPRQFHPYSGYWSISHADYATAIDESLVQRVIPRHRLAKKDRDAASSEAVEPIVYYLDAGVPEPVKSALIDGAMWWNQAFEAIGYENAFQVKILPADADPMDARYNVIQWVHRATRGWSYGSSIIDPRTGEIIKGHVTLGSLRVRQDYLIALGLTSPFSAENVDTSKQKEMALARIRQLSAHEVGHTLGIAHNFAASVNSRASVMDYPHPYVQLKGGNIDLSEAYDTGIGVWDKYVVAYGYSDLAPEIESEALAGLIAKAQNDGLQYMSDPDARPKSGGHATGHLWDNGENAATELSRVLQVREKALSDFGLNSIAVGTPLSEIEQVLVPIYNFHRYQVEAAAKLVAGVNYSYEVKKSDSADGVSPVEGEMQYQAIEALLSTLSAQTLTLNDELISLIPPKAYGYRRDRESFKANTGITFDPVSAAEASAKHTVSLMLNAQRLARLEQQSVMGKDIPSVEKLFDMMLDATVRTTNQKGLAMLVQQRVNQQVVEHMLALWHNKSLVTEVRAQLYVTLKDLADWLDDNRKSRKYQGMGAQFALLAEQIEFSLENGKLVTPASTITLPPGSPIGQDDGHF